VLAMGAACWFTDAARRIRHILEMIRFSHTLFALPFALLSAAMAWRANLREDPPVLLSWREFLGILICMVCARSAAMAFNRLVDRELDAANPRTAGRHLPRGILSVKTVAWFTVVTSAGFIAGTLLFLPRNPWPLMGALPVLGFLFAYSYTKRFTLLSHFWLGSALMLAPVAAWIALRPEFDWAPVLLGTAVLFWVAGFDIIYACQDVEFDRRMRLRSIPARLGVPTALRVAAACHAMMFLALLLLPQLYSEFGLIYYGGIAAIGLLLVIEHRLVEPGDLSRVNQAFFHANAIVSVTLFAVGSLDLVM